MQRTVLRRQAEKNQHISPLMDDLQDASGQMCPGFLWFFSNDGWPEQSSLPCNRFVDLADIKMLWKEVPWTLSMDLTTSRQCERLYFDAVSALDSP